MAPTFSQIAIENGNGLACPYYKMDSQKYERHANCHSERARAWKINQITQHLWRCHSPLYHCPYCTKRWPSVPRGRIREVRERHISGCAGRKNLNDKTRRRGEDEVDLMTEEQQKALAAIKRFRGDNATRLEKIYRALGFTSRLPDTYHTHPLLGDPRSGGSDGGSSCGTGACPAGPLHAVTVHDVIAPGPGPSHALAQAADPMASNTLAPGGMDSSPSSSSSGSGFWRGFIPGPQGSPGQPPAPASTYLTMTMIRNADNPPPTSDGMQAVPSGNNGLCQDYGAISDSGYEGSNALRQPCAGEQDIAGGAEGGSPCTMTLQLYAPELAGMGPTGNTDALVLRGDCPAELPSSDFENMSPDASNPHGSGMHSSGMCGPVLPGPNMHGSTLGGSQQEFFLFL